MKRNILTKDGLTGNSGLGVENMPGVFHVSSNYAAGPKTVFVVEGLDGGWIRMPRTEAESKKRTIIPCSYCRRPAISLDHCWPYLVEATHCAHHRDWRKAFEQKTK